MKMENNCIVYRHIRLDKNEPFYIGIASNEERPFSKKQRNNLWHKIVNKTEYRVDILFDDLTWEEACQKEKEFIALYGRKDLGTGVLSNMTDGGDGRFNSSPTEETRAKMRASSKGNNHTPEINKLIAEKQKGVECPQRGRKGRKVTWGDKVSEYQRKINSGKGITKNKYCSTYRVVIRVNGERLQLGSYKTYEEALKIRLEAEQKYWN